MTNLSANLFPDTITQESQVLLNSITTSVGFSIPFDDIDTIGQPPKPYFTSALWDTGATHCCITKSLAENLELNPIDKVWVEHAVGKS